MLTETDLKKIKIKMNKVERIYKEYKKEQTKTGGSFNICSILRKHNDEVNLHSKFIYELINPNGSHQQDDKFLRLFITEALEIKDFEFKNLQVCREDLTDENRRIDFTIESSNYLIGIEMKIDATDQNKQMYSYFKELKNRNIKPKKNIKLYYLTKYGNEPTKQSLYTLKKIDYNTLSFNIDIEWWLNKCIESTSIPKLKESIKQYLEVIHKIIGQTPKELENKMDNLIKKQDDIKILHNISQDYPRVWAKKEVDFWNELYKKIKKIKIKDKKLVDTINLFASELSEEEFSYEISREEQIKFIREYRHKHKRSCFGVRIIQNIKKYKLYIEIYQWDSSDGIYIDFYLYNTRENIVNSKTLQNKLDDIGFYNSSFKKLDSSEIIFYARDVSEPTFELFDDDKFKAFLAEYTKEIKKIILYINSNKDDIVK